MPKMFPPGFGFTTDIMAKLAFQARGIAANSKDRLPSDTIVWTRHLFALTYSLFQRSACEFRPRVTEIKFVDPRIAAAMNYEHSEHEMYIYHALRYE